MNYSNGDQYEGNWVEDEIIGKGQGIKTYENGDKYNGSFFNGKKVVFGIMTYSNGDKYEGEWF